MMPVCDVIGLVKVKHVEGGQWRVLPLVLAVEGAIGLYGAGSEPGTRVDVRVNLNRLHL
jgi:hypothetical protein